MEKQIGTILNLRILENKLREIEEFRKEDKTPKEIKFNFSNTRWFSAGSLIFLIITIDSLLREGINVKLRIPLQKAEERPEPAQKARDFLKRWKFFETLKFYFGDDAIFLEKDQLDYLTEEQKYYLRSKYLDEQDNLFELYTHKVIEINHFTEKINGGYSLSEDQIGFRLSDFAEKRIIDALKIGIKWGQKASSEIVEEFVTKCIREPLINALYHAEATIGLVTAQIDNKNFIISIADNGVGIPTTIEPLYAYFKKRLNKQNKTITDAELIEYAFKLPNYKEIQLLLDEIDAERDAGLIEFAHLKGITSKPETHKGMGLFLLKDFVEKSKGFFDVRSRSGYVRFKYDDKKVKMISIREKWSSQPGTYISIYFPHKIELKKWKMLK